ncbi:MAG TPA: phosphate signaling complex protein PhoU [Pseudolabrys sp.]|nr:phosphate signaling complex protein PhoU [Pseudolabrys sp.]
MLAFDDDLRELAAEIVEMGNRTERQVSNALDALLSKNVSLAREVKAADGAIDELQRAIETKAIETIARRQPLAIDLREIVGALRIATDLERIGDLASNIAKRAEQIGNKNFANEISVQLRHMTQLVLQQLRSVIFSYEHRDVEEALRVWRSDEDIDGLHNSTFRQLLTYMMEDPGNITLGMHLLFCAKNIERIGDHATNIAESVYFILQGGTIPGERPKLNVTNFQAPSH